MLLTMLTSVPDGDQMFLRGRTYIFGKQKGLELILKGQARVYDPNEADPPAHLRETAVKATYQKR